MNCVAVFIQFIILFSVTSLDKVEFRLSRMSSRIHTGNGETSPTGDYRRSTFTPKDS